MRFVIALTVALSGCTPPPFTPTGPTPPGFVDIPTPAPPYDGDGGNGLGAIVGDACAKLRELHCPEGEPLPSGRTCYEHLVTLSAFADVPASCVAEATSVDRVRECGGPSTVRFRCSR
jgi:hypothetical protein